MVDDIYARTNRLHAGDRHLQNLTANPGRLSCVYAKVADPAQVPAIIAQLKAGGIS